MTSRPTKTEAITRRDFQRHGLAALAALVLAPARTLAAPAAASLLSCRIEASADDTGISVDLYLRNRAEAGLEILQYLHQELATLPEVTLHLAGLQRPLQPNLPSVAIMSRVLRQSWMVVSPNAEAFFGTTGFDWPAEVMAEPSRFVGLVGELTALLRPRVRDAEFDLLPLRSNAVSMVVPNLTPRVDPDGPSAG